MKNRLEKQFLGVVAKSRFEGLITSLNWTGKNLVVVEKSGTIHLLDENLQEISSFVAKGLPLSAMSSQSGETTVVCTQTGRVLVCKQNGDVLSTQTSTRRPNDWEHVGAAFDAATSILWTVTFGEAEDILNVIDIHSGDLLASAHIESFGCCYKLLPIPGGGVVVDGAAGQDGCFVWVASFEDGKLDVRKMGGNDRIACDVSNDGESIFLLLHNDGEASIVSATTDATEGRIASPSLEPAIDGLESEHGFEYEAVYINKRFVVAKTNENRLVLIDIRLEKATAELWPPGYKVNAHDARGKVTTLPGSAIDAEGDISTLC